MMAQAFMSTDPRGFTWAIRNTNARGGPQTAQEMSVRAIREAERILAETERATDHEFRPHRSGGRGLWGADVCRHRAADGEACGATRANHGWHMPTQTVFSPGRPDEVTLALADSIRAILPVLDELAQQATDEECFGCAWRPALDRYDRNRATLAAMDAEAGQ